MSRACCECLCLCTSLLYVVNLLVFSCVCVCVCVCVCLCLQLCRQLCVSLSVCVCVCVFRHWGCTPACSSRACRPRWPARWRSAGCRWWTAERSNPARRTAGSHSTPQCAEAAGTWATSPAPAGSYGNAQGTFFAVNNEGFRLGFLLSVGTELFQM